MRVLHVFGVMNRGGAESMIMNLYRKVDKSKLQFDFVVHRNTPGSFDEEIKEFGGKIYRCPSFSFSSALAYRKWWIDFFNEHKEYSIIHSHIRSSAFVYLRIAKKQGLKTIIHSHSTSNGSGINGAIKTKTQRIALRYSDYYMGCSKEAGLWFFGERIVNGNNYHMLQNAVDLEEFSFSSEKRESIRNTLGLHGKEPVYMHVGRFHPSKNHEFLLNLFSALVRQNPDSMLVLVGDGELRDKIENQIADLGVKENVIMTGVRSDVNSLLLAADCFLFPSNWEGLPVTVVEAQASGLPCFISDRITKDVCVSDLVTSLPIDMGIEPWLTAIKTSRLQRKDVSEEIRSHGFDINDSVKWLTSFYEGIV